MLQGPLLLRRPGSFLFEVASGIPRLSYPLASTEKGQAEQEDNQAKNRPPVRCSLRYEVALRLDAAAVLWFEPAHSICASLGIDPWGGLASGALLAAFPQAAVGKALAALQAEGYPAAVIARAESGVGVHRMDGVEFPRYERDELSRILA